MGHCQHDHDLVYIGDPVIVKQANRAFVANVKNIKVAQRTERSASVTLLGEESTLLLTVHEINLVECDEEPGKLFWDNSYKGKSLEVSGQYVISVRPDVVVSPPPNMSMFCFDKQLILDIGVQLTEEPDGPSTALTKTNKKLSQRNRCTNHVLTCPICNAHVWKYNLLGHYGSIHSDRSIPEALVICQEESDELKRTCN